MVSVEGSYGVILTANSISIHHSHPKIVKPQLSVDTAGDDFMPQHVQAANAIFAILKNLDWFR